MKTYEEKTQRVFQKIEEGAALQRKRRKTIKRMTAETLSLCLVGAIGYGAWKSDVFRKPVVNSLPSVDIVINTAPDYLNTAESATAEQSTAAEQNTSAAQPPTEEIVPTQPAASETADPDRDTVNESAENTAPTAADSTEAQTQKSEETVPTQPAANETTSSGDNRPKETPVNPVITAASTTAAPTQKSTEPAPTQPTSAEPTAPGETKAQEGSHSNPKGYYKWGNKTVEASLYSALSEASADTVIDIVAVAGLEYGGVLDSGYDSNFVYEGKKLSEYYSEKLAEKALVHRLGALLADGDLLKYGTALYEVGAPNGEKWDKYTYDRKMADYGPELLAKYIVNGEFLRSQVETDLENAKKQSAANAYYAARTAFFHHLINTAKTAIPAEMKGDTKILLHMTAEEFKNFTPDFLKEWTFCLNSVPNSGSDGSQRAAHSN